MSEYLDLIPYLVGFCYFFLVISSIVAYGIDVYLRVRDRRKVEVNDEESSCTSLDHPVKKPPKEAKAAWSLNKELLNAKRTVLNYPDPYPIAEDALEEEDEIPMKQKSIDIRPEPINDRSVCDTENAMQKARVPSYFNFQLKRSKFNRTPSPLGPGGKPAPTARKLQCVNYDGIN